MSVARGPRYLPGREVGSDSVCMTGPLRVSSPTLPSPCRGGV